METERLRLCPPSMDHQPLMLEAILESQQELGEFLPWVADSLTHEASVENTLQAIRNFEKFEGDLRYSIFDKESNHFIGAIGLIVKDKSIPCFEIGYWIRSSSAGHGYITEAVKVIEDYAFNELDAERIEIIVAKSNDKSQAVAQRCEYQREGTLRRARRLPNGQLDDSVIYSKIRADQKRLSHRT